MKDIDNILNKYFEGETSLDEEKLLRQYFNSNEVDEEHLMYAPIFQYFAEEKQETVTISKPKKKDKLTLWTAIAACAAILLIVILTIRPISYFEDGSYVYIDGKKYNDIEEVNIQALNALMIIEDEGDEDVLESQIDILDSFIETDVND